MCPDKIKNDCEFLFDNKHRYAQMCNQKVSVQYKGTAHLWGTSKLYRSFANTILSKCKPQKLFPPMTGFTFGYSQKDRLLQAADILSHLFYASLKAEKGLTTGDAQLKYQMLKHVMPGLVFDSDLLKSLQVVNGELEITSINFGGCFQLEP